MADRCRYKQKTNRYYCKYICWFLFYIDKNYRSKNQCHGQCGPDIGTLVQPGACVERSPPLAESKDTAVVAAGDGVHRPGWFWIGLWESGLPPRPAVAVIVNSSISGVSQFFFMIKLLSMRNP